MRAKVALPCRHSFDGGPPREPPGQLRQVEAWDIPVFIGTMEMDCRHWWERAGDIHRSPYQVLMRCGILTVGGQPRQGALRRDLGGVTADVTPNFTVRLASASDDVRRLISG